MRIYLLTLFFLCLLSSIFSQNSAVDLCGVYQNAVENKSLDSISNLIIKDSSLVSDYEKAELLSMRGYLLLSFNKKNIKRRRVSNNPIFIDALKDFTSAIDLAQDKNDQLKHTFRRFVSLKKYKPHYSNFQTDLNLLKPGGYKKDKFGLAIIGKSKYDGDLWLGAEFSVGSGFQPSYKLKDHTNNIIHKSRQFSASFLIIGYTQNITNTKLSDFNFSLIRLESPFFIDIFQFGFIDSGDENFWYYRPELGFGYSIFQFSTGYNVFFKSGETSQSLSRFMVNFRLKHIF